MSWQDTLKMKDKTPKKYKYLTVSFGVDVRHLRDWVKAQAAALTTNDDRVYESDVIKALIHNAMEEAGELARDSQSNEVKGAT